MSPIRPLAPPGEIPRFEVSGYDPGLLEDMAAGVIPKGWQLAADRKQRFYGFNATNQCCRRWMLLGWPSDDDGRPKGIEEGRGWVRIECARCHKDLFFDLAHPDLTEDRPKVGPPAVVAGRIKQ